MASPDNSSYKKLVDKLRELFELDKADLDFGIYRIIGQRQDQIDDFLSNQLKNSVAEVLSGAASSQQAELEADLTKAEQSARDAGFEPEQAPKVKELREKLAALGSSHRVEHEVYEHLYRFFSRYYEEGDFISQRRVSRNARYAIPYNGEEVKLHWANADQYYIKSSENFRDYRFKLTDGRGVHFKLLDADTNRDNTKGDKRFFRLADDTPVADNCDELLIHFHYSTLNEKKIIDADGKEKPLSQKVFNGLTLQALGEQLPDAWSEALSALQATKANPKRTLLEKHLNDYTAKNSFDYFIHKDLGGFLRQELDFYIKNEVMFLDDIEDAEAPKVESYLRSLKAIRRVAGKVIDFLAQLESFQKKLWLKKKFVVQCDYCITLDRVPEELYAEIAANEAQIAEWRKWGFVEDDANIDEAYLLAQPYLLVDTKYFSADFKFKLLSSMQDIDVGCDGLLVKSDNHQALEILQSRYENQVKCIYIDPPYNTGNKDFLYKECYQHSSWLSMLFDRLNESVQLLREDGGVFISIDENEHHNLLIAADSVFGFENRVADFSWITEGNFDNQAKIKTAHESVLFYASNEKFFAHPPVVDPSASEDSKLFRDEIRNTIVKNGPKNPVGTVLIPVGFPADVESCDIDIVDINWPQYSRNIVIENWRVKFPVEATSGWSSKAQLDLFIESSFESVLDTKGQQTRFLITKTGAIESVKIRSEDQSYVTSIIRGVGTVQSMKSTLIGMGCPYPDYPKPLGLVSYLVSMTGEENSVVLDYFAGSGTTGHAVINLNREDNGDRKYILVEQGAHFDTVIKPRIQKAVYSESWRDGKPVAKDEDSNNPRNGVSHCFKYMKLESYEDTLNNLELSHSGKQQELLAQHADVKEDYLLNYMLDVEARGSLLKVDAFNQPFEYQLHIATDSAGETRKQTVDLVETFNYLLGLRVHTQRQDTVHVSCKKDEHGVWQRDSSSSKASGKEQAGEPDSYTFLSIDGTLPDGKSALVVWRILNDFDEPVSKTCHNIALDYFLMERKRINPREGELDVIYVNGDNTLPNIRAEEEHWKVRLIEEEFQRLMFAGEL